MTELSLEHRWDLVDAVSRSPLFGSAQIVGGIELADVEQMLLDTDELPAVERERLIAAVRTLADVYVRLAP